MRPRKTRPRPGAASTPSTAPRSPTPRGHTPSTTIAAVAERAMDHVTAAHIDTFS
ncbi:hypothetical protein [Streptomyces griseoviridis]|uniref:hypothetical protein n=1 Tax=Streptomyces griseoviridis TaxID=45398 RepID=UPI0034120142